MLLYLISMRFICHLCSFNFSFASFPFFSNILFPPSPPPVGLCWCHRTNKTYAFLPRVGWAGTSRVSVWRFWGGRAPLHAAVAAGTGQYRCSAAAFFYPLPVPQTWQVRLLRGALNGLFEAQMPFFFFFYSHHTMRTSACAAGFFSFIIISQCHA